jgi:hypothetical protein
MPSDSEGIAALFSMYNDDDDEEEEEADEPKTPSSALPTTAAPNPARVSSPPLSQAGGEGLNPSQVPPSPPLTEESAGRKTLASPALPPLPSRRSSSPFAVSSPSPLRPPSSAPPADLPRAPRRGALAIVDYAHDEMAMSPEKEVEPVKYVFSICAPYLLVFWVDVSSYWLQDGEIISRAHRSGSNAQAAEGRFEIRDAIIFPELYDCCDVYLDKLQYKSNRAGASCFQKTCYMFNALTLLCPTFLWLFFLFPVWRTSIVATSNLNTSGAENLAVTWIITSRSTDPIYVGVTIMHQFQLVVPSIHWYVVKDHEVKRVSKMLASHVLTLGKLVVEKGSSGETVKKNV